MRLFAKTPVSILCLLLAGMTVASCSDIEQRLRLASRPITLDHVGATATPDSGAPNNPEALNSPTELDTRKPPMAAKTFVGTGVFTKEGSDAAITSDAATGDITFNFVDTDIREVARSLIGNTLKANYVIDPRVQANITAQISRPIPLNRVIPTLESILAMYGFAISTSDGVYRILPAADAAKSPTIPRLASELRGEGFGIGIVPLRHVSASEMSKILEPMTPSGAVLKADTARNLLLIAGTQEQREALLGVVNTFDVNWFAGMSFALIPLTSSDTRSVTDDLEKIFGDNAEGPFAGLVKFAAIERMNAILVMTSRPDYLLQARQWIERLDASTEAKEKRLFVYYMQNARASEVALVLNQIFGLGRLRGAGGTYGALAPGLNPAEIQSRGARSGSRFSSNRGGGLSDNRQQRQSSLEGRSIFSGPGRGMDGRNASPYDTSARDVMPQGIPSYETGNVAAPIFPDDSSGSAALSQNQDIRIIPDLANNSLVVLCTPAEYRQILGAVRRLDIAPLQVLIEATIAEVGLTQQLRYGVQSFFDVGSNTFTRSTANTGAVNPAFPGFAYVLSTSNVRVVLDALSSITNVKVISSPKLMVLNNRTAELSVGDQVPIATQSAVSVIAPDAPRVNTIEFRDTGVVLQVTPRVNAGGLITLDIDQEVSDAVPTTTSTLDSPTIQQRRISSSVAVHSGQTIALGGLIKDQQTKGNTGVPLLSDIPVVNFFFSSKNNEGRRTELLVLITPRVIRGGEDTRFIMEEMKKKIQVFEPEPSSL